MKLIITVVISISIFVSGASIRFTEVLLAAENEFSPTAKSQLEKRLGQFGANVKGLSRETLFCRRAQALLNSDAIEDARTDVAAGHIGIMSIWQHPGVGRNVAPGIFCGKNQKENIKFLRGRVLFTLEFVDARRPNELCTSGLYENYAKIYNEYVMPFLERKGITCALEPFRPIGTESCFSIGVCDLMP